MQTYIVSVIGFHLHSSLIQTTGGVSNCKPKFDSKTIDQLAVQFMKTLFPKLSLEEYDVTALATVLRSCNWFENVSFRKIKEIRNMLSYNSTKYITYDTVGFFQLFTS